MIITAKRRKASEEKSLEEDDLENKTQLNIRNLRLKMKLNEKRGSSLLNDKEQRIKTIDDKINELQRKIQMTDRESRALDH